MKYSNMYFPVLFLLGFSMYTIKPPEGNIVVRVGSCVAVSQRLIIIFGDGNGGILLIEEREQQNKGI